MADFITMTSKGTFTMPAYIRKELGLTKAGDKMRIELHRQSKTVELRTVPDLKELQARAAAYIKQKGIAPIRDEQLRKVRQEAWGERWGRYVKQDD